MIPVAPFENARYNAIMPRRRDPYVLILRTLPSGKRVYYYRLPGSRVMKSTGETTKYHAERYVRRVVLPLANQSVATVGQYLAPFFTPSCPHCTRLRDENKRISAHYIAQTRSRLERYILPDRIAGIPIAELRRADILDFRARLLAGKTGASITNAVIGILKVACKEAYYREDVDRDPSAGVGLVKYAGTVRGTFSAAELAALFRVCPGVWGDDQAYTAFHLAATTGMRRSEVLELRWQQVDLEVRMISVDRARTDDGTPKWGRVRQAPISERTAAILKRYKAASFYVLPHQPLFCDIDGDAWCNSWWDRRFARAMDRAGFDRVGRNLTPHSFRHTLNSRLREQGVDPAGIRAAMGWAGERVQDGYTHWQEWEQYRKVVDGLF